MAAASGRNRCVVCGKEKVTFKCRGCSQEYCFNDLANHKQELSKQLDEVEVSRDLFQQSLTEQTSKPQKHDLIQQIDKWERHSINQIRQTAEEARQIVLKHTNEHIKELETKLNKLTEQLRQSREENDFYETDLLCWKKELTLLTGELMKPSNLAIREDSSSFVTKITVDIVSGFSRGPSIGVNAKWRQNGITVAGGNGEGSGLNQLALPFGIYVDDDQTVFIADCDNHRILEWKSGATSGKVVAGGNGKGNRSDQLNGPLDVILGKEKDCLIICDQGNRRVIRWPRQSGAKGETIISGVDCLGLAMDDDGCLYVSDSVKQEVKRWRIGDSYGMVVAGGNGQGDRIDQLHNPNTMFVDEKHSVYVSDENNHRVMKWMKGDKGGIMVAGGQGQGNGLTQLWNPSGVVVDQMGVVYVTDFLNHRVMCWSKGAWQGYIVAGGNGEGKNANQFMGPSGLSFDRQGNLYVADSNNHRVQKFKIDSS